jgi:hypothetical protein
VAGAEPVEVGPRLRLGDREDHLERAVGEPGQESFALLIGAVFGDHGGRDRRGDDEQQQLAGPRLGDERDRDSSEQ